MKEEPVSTARRKTSTKEKRRLIGELAGAATTRANNELISWLEQGERGPANESRPPPKGHRARRNHARTTQNPRANHPELFRKPLDGKPGRNQGSFIPLQGTSHMNEASKESLTGGFHFKNTLQDGLRRVPLQGGEDTLSQPYAVVLRGARQSCLGQPSTDYTVEDQSRSTSRLELSSFNNSVASHGYGVPPRVSRHPVQELFFPCGPVLGLRETSKDLQSTQRHQPGSGQPFVHAHGGCPPCRRLSLPHHRLVASLFSETNHRSTRGRLVKRCFNIVSPAPQHLSNRCWMILGWSVSVASR